MTQTAVADGCDTTLYADPEEFYGPVPEYFGMGHSVTSTCAPPTSSAYR